MILGDNAGRFALSGEPKQFVAARSKGIWVLPGTDPLPFADQASRVGRYGMAIRGGFDRDKPAASVLAHLETTGDQPETYGKTDGPLSFFRLQIGMQLRKRLGKRRT